LIYTDRNNSNSRRNILSAPTNGHLVLRASDYFTNTGTAENPNWTARLDRSIEIELSNVMMGTFDMTTPSWKPVIVNPGGANITDVPNPPTHPTLRTSLSDTIKINDLRPGSTMILEIWVTHFGPTSLPPQGDNPLAPALDRDNFTIRTVLITVIDDSTHNALGANFVLDSNTAVDVGGEPIVITPNQRARPLRINNVFFWNFAPGAPANNMSNLTAYQWLVEVEGTSVEVVVGNTLIAAGRKESITGTSDPPAHFTQAQNIMTIRPILIDSDDPATRHSGISTVTIRIKRTDGMTRLNSV
jgi:hypothetical protein